MREIKFRAWIRNEMVYLPFAALQYFDFEGTYAMSFVVDGYTDFWAHEQYQTATERYCKNAPIMQFTGLKDKNGKEIYEGDIIEVNMGVSVGGYASNGAYEAPQEIKYLRTVEWKDNNAKLDWAGNHSGSMLCSGNSKYFEIIGNIYENPELLK